MTVDTVCFDAGGVLVHPNWSRVAEVLAGHGVAVAAAALQAADPGARKAIDSAPFIGATTDRTRSPRYFELVLRGAGVKPGPATERALEELAAQHARENLWHRVDPTAADVLGRLRQAGLRLLVISNANGTLHALMDRLGLSAYFKVMLDSAVEGLEKPDPRLFARALERAGGRPERALHVGDLYHVDVVGARAAGLRPVLFDPADLYTDADCPRISSLAALLPLAGA